MLRRRRQPGDGGCQIVSGNFETQNSGILDTGAQAVVTSCQQCVRTMTTYVRRNKVDLEVLDITQLVQKALKPG
jgi:Fe-S oxidoreductase